MIKKKKGKISKKLAASAQALAALNALLSLSGKFPLKTLLNNTSNDRLVGRTRAYFQRNPEQWATNFRSGVAKIVGP